MLGYQMTVLMLGDQVAVLIIEDQEPSAAEAVVQQKQWCRNQCSRGSDAVQSSRSMDGRILSLLRGSVENM